MKANIVDQPKTTSSTPVKEEPSKNLIKPNEAAIQSGRIESVGISSAQKPTSTKPPVVPAANSGPVVKKKKPTNQEKEVCMIFW